MGNFQVFDDLSNEEYHKAKGISSSDFSLIAKSCLAYEYKGLMSWSSPALSIGTLYHTAILEPDKLEEEFFVCPTKGTTTKAALEAQETNPGKTMVTEDDLIKAKQAAARVNAVFGDILGEMKKEYSFFVEDENYGIIRKVRPDAHNDTIVIDIKTTREDNPQDFFKSFFKYRYDRQAAYYFDTLRLTGIDIEEFYIIAVPTVGNPAPFGIRVSEEVLEKGRFEYLELLSKYRDYKISEKDNNRFADITLPEWMKR